MKKISKQTRKMEAVEKPEMTVGLDIGDRYSRYCLLNEEGDVVGEGRMQSTEEALRRHFEGKPEMRIALECGTHSPWISRLLTALGHQVIVPHPAGRADRAAERADRRHGQAVEELAAKYPEIALLRTAPGVGPIVAAAYVLTLDRPDAASNRSAGAFLGLRPGQSQSGDSDPQRRISKTGDRCLRSLLVQSAQYILPPQRRRPVAGAPAWAASGPTPSCADGA